MLPGWLQLLPRLRRRRQVALHDPACRVLPHLLQHAASPLRTAAAGGYALRSSYSLAIVAKDRRFDMEAGGDVYRDVLCLCPPRPSSSSSSRGGITPWQFKDAIFPSQMPGSFHGDKVFSFGGHAFWADLAKGVLFCRCDDALSGRNDDAVQFRYIPLPVECHLKISFAMRGDLQLCRTMSCVDGGGDSIKFVCISDGGSSSAHTGDRAITMWTLTLATGEWLKDAQLMVADLWELEGFDKARLPKAIPISPVLNPQEDGVLSFMLNDADAELYMVSLNMHSKKLLSSLTLSSCPDDIVPPLGLDLSKDLQNLSLALLLLSLFQPRHRDAQLQPRGGGRHYRSDIFVR